MEKQRFCLTLDLVENEELVIEYEFWHRSENIWPEIPEGIRKMGILSMEIWRYGTRLFMIMDTVPEFDFDRDMARLALLPKQKEWEAFVGRFQRSAPGSASSEKWRRMDKIFSL